MNVANRTVGNSQYGILFEPPESDHSTIRNFVPSLPLPGSGSKRARALDEDRADASPRLLAAGVGISSGFKSSLRSDRTAIIANEILSTPF